MDPTASAPNDASVQRSLRADPASSSAPPTSIAQPLSTSASRRPARRLIEMFPTAEASGDATTAAAARPASSSSPSSSDSLNASAAIAMPMPSSNRARRGSSGGVTAASRATWSGRTPNRTAVRPEGMCCSRVGGSGFEPVGRGERQHAEDRRQQPVGAQRPAAHRGVGEQPGAGEGKADPGPQQRGQVLQADLDRDPGAGPDEDEEGVQPPDEGSGHRGLC